MADMRERYEAQLRELHAQIIRMGEMIQRAILSAVSALRVHEEATARAVIAGDEEIDRQEKTIESLCLRLLMMEQPVATDLRRVSAALKVITDMERIGDHAADLGELTLMLRGAPGIGADDLGDMANKTCGMLLDSVTAFVSEDAEKARAVIAADDEVDALFLKVKADVVQAIRSDVDAGEEAADLLMAAKYFERIGDHATNIAEWAVFAATGRHED